MANLAGWPYWKVISITGQSGAGTDYQVKLTIGDSAGGDFHLEGHCTNFPQDIRITDDDGTTLLDHFVLDLTADPIIVKVEVKDDLGSNQDIRIYYGKSGETTASNGANTFLQYHGSATATFDDSDIINSTSFVFEAKARQITQTGSDTCYIGVQNEVYPWTTGDELYIDAYRPGANGRRFFSRNDGVHTSMQETPEWTTNQWYALKIVKTATTADGYLDNNPIGTQITTNLPNEDMGLFMYEAGSNHMEQAWSFARKYNSPEPAFSSAGVEQTPPTGVSPTAVFYGPLVGPLGGPI